MAKGTSKKLNKKSAQGGKTKASKKPISIKKKPASAAIPMDKKAQKAQKNQKAVKKEFDIIQYKTLYKPSIPEIEFEEALNKLHQKWNRLSKEDEQIIINIAKKF